MPFLWTRITLKHEASTFLKPVITLNHFIPQLSPIFNSDTTLSTCDRLDTSETPRIAFSFDTSDTFDTTVTSEIFKHLISQICDMESETFDTINTFDNTDAPRYLMTPSYTIGTSDTPTPLTPLIPLFSTSSGFVSMKNNGSAIFFSSEKYNS